MSKTPISIFWFRRDLRLEDNHGLHKALQSKYPVLPIFIFDKEIIENLDRKDPRISFIYECLQAINIKLNNHETSIFCAQGTPADVWKQLITKFDIKEVYANEDYEPYGIQRDERISTFLKGENIKFSLFKDHVIFAKNEVLKKDNTPYTVYTPYKNKWLEKYHEQSLSNFPINDWNNFFKVNFTFPKITDLGFVQSSIEVLNFKIDALENYGKLRDYPAKNSSSNLGPHLRFGTVSIRKMVQKTKSNAIFLSELIWREFFMQIMFHFPKVVTNNFKSKYDKVIWRNDVNEFEKWKVGMTGYPMIDAGMRELNQTGYMHNRVRMITAGFLCKHLLIDWRWGEAYFASKLLDYELSSNNGNWQWSAGTGCDAAPYFRIFNPTTQVKKFDSKLDYINKWIPEFNSLSYPTAMVDHKIARERALTAYKLALN